MMLRARLYALGSSNLLRVPRTAGLLLCPGLAMVCGVFPAFAAGTYFVDNGSTTCSSSGPGTEANPYCTISAALAARGGPGTTILVKPGVYREAVTIAASGISGSPLVIQALGSGVIVDGSDDFADTTRWAHASGTVFVASTVTWSTLQVFANGQRLTPSTAAVASLPVGAFRYVSGQGLYVNLGGPNPGNHVARVGRRSYGFRVAGGQWITIQGFTVTHTEDRSIHISSAASNIGVIGNHVMYSNKYGIQSDNCSSITIAGNTVSHCNDHGIHLSSGSSASLIEDNESFLNARPLVRAANGIMLSGSSGNTVQRNRCHDNQDTGFQINSGSNNNTLRENLSWGNGDHGYDHLTSTGNRHVNNVAYGNYKDGFSFEGNSPNNSLRNCVSIDNGLTTNEYDLWVDANSAVGFQSDYNMFWNSTAQKPVKYISTSHATLATYQAASGKDAHSLQQNPLFLSPAAGDFHVHPGSLAIDDADAGAPGWLAADADGRARFDVATAPNTGNGTPSFSDRGVFEHYPSPGGDDPPLVSAPATVITNPGARVLVNVSVSDPDGDPIHVLTANFSSLPAPNDAVFVTNATRTAGVLMWTPAAGVTSGPFAVTFTATNAATASRTTLIAFPGDGAAPVVSVPASSSGTENAPLTVHVMASDPDGDPISSLTADFSGLPAGHDATFTPEAGNVGGTLTWTPTLEDAPGPHVVTFTAMNELSGSASTAITVANVDRPPVITAPKHANAVENGAVTIHVSAVDPDGDAITELSANLLLLGTGSGAIFTTNATHTAGTLTWVPAFDDGREPVYNVVFTARNTAAATATTSIAVANVDRPPIVTAPVEISTLEGATVTIEITASDPDGDDVQSLTADLSLLPAGNDAVFLRGGPPTQPIPAGHAGETQAHTGTRAGMLSASRTPVTAKARRYETDPGEGSNPQGGTTSTIVTYVLIWTPTFEMAPGPYAVSFTAANALSGSASTSIAVMNQDQAPIVVAPATASVAENARLSLGVLASDPDGEAIGSLAAADLPSGATFIANEAHTGGTLEWTPDFGAAPGPYLVTFTATNALSGVASTSITVTNQDRAPVVVAPATANGTEGERVSFEVTASDPDGEPIGVLEAADLPSGATFTVNETHTRGTLEWTPDLGAAPGPYVVTFTASNASGGVASTSIEVSTTDSGGVATAERPALDPPSAADSRGLGTDGRTYGFPASAPRTVAEGTPGKPGSRPLRGWLDPARSEVSLDVNGRGIVARIETGAIPGDLTATLVGPGGSVESAQVQAGGDLDGNGIPEQRVSFTAVDLATAFSGSPAGSHVVRAKLLIDWGGVISTLPVDLTVIRPEGIVVALSPNPLRESAHIRFLLPVPGPVRVEIIGVDGRRVANLANVARHGAGLVEVPISRRNIMPGLYFYRIVTDSGSAAGRFVVLGP